MLRTDMPRFGRISPRWSCDVAVQPLDQLLSRGPEQGGRTQTESLDLRRRERRVSRCRRCRFLVALTVSTFAALSDLLYGAPRLRELAAACLSASCIRFMMNEAASNMMRFQRRGVRSASIRWREWPQATRASISRRYSRRGFILPQLVNCLPHVINRALRRGRWAADRAGLAARTCRIVKPTL